MNTSTNLMSFANNANAVHAELMTNGKTGGMCFDYTEQSTACDMLIDFAAKVNCCEGFKADILGKAKAGQVLSEKQAWVLAFAIAPAITESNIALFTANTKQAAGNFDDLPMQVDENTPFEVVKRYMEARRLGLR
jgi:hypothetical protein